MTLVPTTPDPGRITLFEDAPPGPRSIPSSIAVAAPALLAIVGARTLADPPSQLEGRFVALAAALPSVLTDVLVLLAFGPAVVALLFVAAAARWSRRAAISGITAAALGVGGAALLAILGPGPAEGWRVDLGVATGWAPSAWVLGPATALFALAGHLRGTSARWARRLAHLAVVATLLAATASPTGAAAGLAAAIGLAALLAIALPPPERVPNLGQLTDALGQHGIPIHELVAVRPATTAPDRQRFEGTDAAGLPLVVDVRSAAASNGRLIVHGFRQLWFRHVGDPVVVGAHRQVRAEALTTLLVAEAGVPTDRVVRVLRLPSGDAALVTRPAPGVVVADRTRDTASSPIGPRLWPILADLHRAGLHHGRVDAHHLVDDGDLLSLVGFAVGGEAGPAEQRIDRAQALVTSVGVDGQAAAIETAHAHLGDDLGEIVSYLQPATLTRGQRRSGLDLADLRTATAAAAGVDEPMLAPVKRVKPLAALQIALLPVAVAGLWAVASEIDRTLLWEQVRTASLPLIVLAVFLGQVPRIAQAFSSLGASPVSIPLGPLYALQLAVSYVNLVVPGGAGRVALNVRFYQRFGLPAGSALAVGALDGLGGLVVQIIVVAAMAAVGVATLDLDLDLGIVDDPTGLLRPLLLLVLVVAVALVAFGGLRRRLFGWVAGAVRDAGSVFRGLWTPRRLGLLVGGNLVSDLTFALTLLTLTHALGDPVGLVELLLITMAVAVLAWVIPVPGGIGVSETGLLVGLVGAGMPEETAFAAMVIYRLAVFYAPPIWGFVALRWLERNRYV